MLALIASKKARLSQIIRPFAAGAVFAPTCGVLTPLAAQQHFRGTIIEEILANLGFTLTFSFDFYREYIGRQGNLTF